MFAFVSADCESTPRPIPDVKKKWKLELYIQNKEKRVAHPRRSRQTKTRNRKAFLPETLGELGDNRPNPIRKV